MSASTAKTLISLLRTMETSEEVLELQILHDRELTFEQRQNLLMLQARFERLQDDIRQTIKEHE